MKDENKALGIASALLVLVLGAVFYYYKTAGTAPAVPPAAPAPAAPAAAPSAPVASPAETLPKLQDSDAFVRAKAAPLSNDPTFASWLKTDDLLARFAAAVSIIGKGKVPKDGLSFMAPHKKFRVRKKGDGFVAEPASFARYDAVAAAFGSIDAAGAAKLFQDFKPLFQEAYQALGERAGDVQDAVVRAATVLLKTPSAGSSAALKEKGLVYAYADESLESLSPAQKQLLRMGPKNQAKIQAKVREFVQALGVPDSQLPK